MNLSMWFTEIKTECNQLTGQFEVRKYARKSIILLLTFSSMFEHNMILKCIGKKVEFK